MHDAGGDAQVLPKRQVSSRHETIAAIATAPGPAGVAVIRVSGPEAFAVAERLTGRKVTRRGMSLRRVCAGDGGLIDEAVVLAFVAPDSYTGEDVVEFQCHGGTVTPRRVLEACLTAGARLARRGEFTERAFLNGRLDYDQAESVLDLIQAKTARAADAALEGLSGRRRRVGRALYEQALALSSELEHALDVDEGELPADFYETIRAKAASLDASLGASIARIRESRLLREGARVVLAGAPNAGKSSLLNALVGENRAIVSDRPGTTRDVIEVWLDLEGWPVRLIDTAGLRETDEALEAEGVARAEKLIEEADVVVFLGEGREKGEEGKSAENQVLHQLLPSSPPSLIPIHPKCDLGRGAALNVSAKTGEGLAELRRAIVAALEKRAAETTADASFADDDAALSALLEARTALASSSADGAANDLVLIGNAVRQAAERLGAFVGATYSEDLLDRLFSRFCVGK